MVVVAYFRLVKPHEFSKLKPGGNECMSVPNFARLWVINLINNILIGTICGSLDFLIVASPTLEILNLSIRNPLFLQKINFRPHSFRDRMWEVIIGLPSIRIVDIELANT